MLVTLQMGKTNSVYLVIYFSIISICVVVLITQLCPPPSPQPTDVDSVRPSSVLVPCTGAGVKKVEWEEMNG